MQTRLWLAIVISTLGAAVAQDMHQPGKLHGKVTDESGARIMVAAVLVHPDRQMTKVRHPPDFGADIRLEVNQKGEFTAVLAPGLYDVVAFANVFSPQCAKVRITEGGTEERDFVLPLDPVVRRTTD
jgi:hypothetical protein